MTIQRRSLLVAALALPAPALAQAFPTRPIRLICPFAAGGSADASARQLAEPLSAVLGQPVVVENRPGGGATLGAEPVGGTPQELAAMVLEEIERWRGVIQAQGITIE